MAKGGARIGAGRPKGSITKTPRDTTAIIEVPVEHLTTPDSVQEKIRLAITAICTRVQVGSVNQNDVLALRSLLPVFTPVLSARYEQAEINEKFNSSELATLVIQQLRVHESSDKSINVFEDLEPIPVDTPTTIRES